MIVEFNQMPDSSRIWIYQANRAFTAEELKEIEKNTLLFLENWKGHGRELKSSYTILYNQFLVLSVDEDFASVGGCSIDDSMQFVQFLERTLNVTLTDRLLLSYKEKDVVKVKPMNDFKKAISEGIINENTLVFNNLVQTKKELETLWEVPLKESWHQRFLVS